jgi:hypothetical protein
MIDAVKTAKLSLLQRIKSAFLPKVFVKNNQSAMESVEIVQQSKLLLTAQSVMQKKEDVHQDYAPVDHSNVQLWGPDLD